MHIAKGKAPRRRREQISEMRLWVAAVRNGDDLKEIIPVDVSPTLEHADLLSLRLEFIQDHLIDGKPFESELH